MSEAKECFATLREMGFLSGKMELHSSYFSRNYRFLEFWPTPFFMAFSFSSLISLLKVAEQQELT